MEIVSKLAVLLIFTHKLPSASRYAGKETYISHLVPTHWLGLNTSAILHNMCVYLKTWYLQVDTHSYAYAHGLFYLCEQCVLINIQKVPWDRVYVLLTDLFTEATVYRQHASPQPWKFGLRSYQKQSQRLKNYKFSWGSMPPDPPRLRKSMSSIIFLDN